MNQFFRAGQVWYNLANVSAVHVAAGANDTQPPRSITIDMTGGSHVVITDADEIAAVLAAVGA